MIDRRRIRRERWFDGYRAHGVGHRLESCPYQAKDEIEYWTKGWQTAAADREVQAEELRKQEELKQKRRTEFRG